MLSYQDYISQNYVELTNTNNVHVNEYIQRDIYNKNILKLTFNINYNSYIIKKDCIMILYWYGGSREAQPPCDLSNYNKIGFKNYNIEKNHLNIKNQLSPYTLILYNELNKNDLINNLFELQNSNTHYALLFDDFNYNSEIDYNRQQKQKEQKIIYEKEQEINYKYRLLSIDNGINKKDKRI